MVSKRHIVNSLQHLFMRRTSAQEIIFYSKFISETSDCRVFLLSCSHCLTWSRPVWCEHIRRSNVSPRPSLSSVWPSPRQTPGPPYPYPSNGNHDVSGRPLCMMQPPDRDKTESDGSIFCRESRHMPVEANLALPYYAGYRYNMPYLE